MSLNNEHPYGQPMSSCIPSERAEVSYRLAHSGYFKGRNKTEDAGSVAQGMPLFGDVSPIGKQYFESPYRQQRETTSWVSQQDHAAEEQLVGTPDEQRTTTMEGLRAREGVGGSKNLLSPTLEEETAAAENVSEVFTRCLVVHPVTGEEVVPPILDGQVEYSASTHHSPQRIPHHSPQRSPHHSPVRDAAVQSDPTPPPPDPIVSLSLNAAELLDELVAVERQALVTAEDYEREHFLVEHRKAAGASVMCWREHTARERLTEMEWSCRQLLYRALDRIRFMLEPLPVALTVNSFLSTNKALTKGEVLFAVSGKDASSRLQTLDAAGAELKREVVDDWGFTP